MDNNNQGMEREKMVTQEADENTVQRYCFRIIFIISTGTFIAYGFFLASHSSTSEKIIMAFLTGLIGKILLRRVFTTNTRTDRTSSLDYILSSQEARKRINEMFAFEAHNYSHEFILKDVNKHLPLNSRQN
ncbi:16982_t:CDS:1 [Gigaspora margarita]|uniref:16982_t:CDS:1 n=1 Tax=Gigaspora margarita TaxID=4874 RepID=A0ABN7VK99_GIGMA|nr:16982_t:CDS:1 [Gigaspora margarita]